MHPTARFIIRPVSTSDEAQWRPLWADYLRFYKTELPEAVYDATFARLTSAQSGMHGLIAAAEGKPLGLVHYLFHASFWKIEPVCYLADLFTVPEARGMGVARALIRAVYAAADGAGAPSVYWMTAETNYRGRLLYDQVGVKTPFIEYNRVP